MNHSPVPPIDHEDDEFPADESRLTALALDEISDEEEARALRATIAADPRLQREFAQTQALAAALRKGFSEELKAGGASPRASQVSGSPGAVPDAAKRRHHAGGFGAVASRRPEDNGKNNILRFVFAGASALGAAALLFLALRIHEPFSAPGPVQPSESLATTTADVPPAPQPGGIRLRPSAGDEHRVAVRPTRPGGVRVAPPSASPGATNLAGLVSRLPARVPRGGENNFVPIENPPREIALCLASAGRDYARRLHDSMALGRLPDRELLRIDGLVNAFAAVPETASAAPGIELVAEVIPAPWALGHWLVRATVQAGGMDASIAATQARASVRFSPVQTASWRLLGCEDGGENSPALELPAVIRAGEVLTTLFELVPAASAETGHSLGELRIAFTGKTGKRVESVCKIEWPAPGGIETATDETRIAAAAAALGLALRQSPHRGGATVALAGRIAGAANLPDRALFDSLLRDSMALERN